jgi:hypothetical protein
MSILKAIAAQLREGATLEQIADSTGYSLEWLRLLTSANAFKLL